MGGDPGPCTEISTGGSRVSEDKPKSGKAPQWKPGQSGNPKGRPPGRPDARSRFRRAIQAKGDELLKVVLDAALAGDMAALKLCLDRLAPPLRPSAEPIEVDLPENGTAQEQAAAVLAAIARGEVSVPDGKLLIDAISAVSSLSELPAILSRLDALEQKS